MGMAQQVVHDAERISAERAWVIPPFAERELEIAHGRPLDRKLSVMPRRPGPIDRRHRLALTVSMMHFLIAPAVAEVDASNKSDVALGLLSVTDDNHLLVMRPAPPHSLVEQNLAAGRVHQLAQVPILLGAETEPVEV
jgi:hypothetical protein